MLLGGLGALGVLIVSAWVGGRLLLRRSSWASPEFLLGASLFIGGVFALPLAMAGSNDHVPADLRIRVGLAGYLAAVLMTVTQAAFVWIVFRRHALWARILVLALGAMSLALLVSQQMTTGLPSYFLEQRGPMVWNALVLQIMYAWASFEPLAYHARLRRQLRIGIGSPAAADRMLLWGLANACSFVSNGSITAAALLFGVNPLQSPALLTGIGLLALGSSVCLWLAFLAPARLLEKRHAADPAAG